MHRDRRPSFAVHSFFVQPSRCPSRFERNQAPMAENREEVDSCPECAGPISDTFGMCPACLLRVGVEDAGGAPRLRINVAAAAGDAAGWAETDDIGEDVDTLAYPPLARGTHFRYLGDYGHRVGDSWRRTPS